MAHTPLSEVRRKARMVRDAARQSPERARTILTSLGGATLETAVSLVTRSYISPVKEVTQNGLGCMLMFASPWAITQWIVHHRGYPDAIDSTGEKAIYLFGVWGVSAILTVLATGGIIGICEAIKNRRGEGKLDYLCHELGAQTIAEMSDRSEYRTAGLLTALCAYEEPVGETRRKLESAMMQVIADTNVDHISQAQNINGYCLRHEIGITERRMKEASKRQAGEQDQNALIEAHHINYSLTVLGVYVHLPDSEAEYYLARIAQFDELELPEEWHPVLAEAQRVLPILRRINYELRSGATLLRATEPQTRSTELLRAGMKESAEAQDLLRAGNNQTD